MESSVFEKLTVLGEGAKYDVSCSSSGHARVNVGRIGSAACAGICHTWTADGRCMSLLKVLLSNDCVYNCKYCVNRRSAEVARRTFEPRELAELTIEFYRRNYIEGLFLSSAVFVSPDHTAERMYECLWLLREVHGFAGYVHAKIVPGVSPELLTQIGLVADRLSVNIELPTSESLSLLAPQKKPEAIFAPMTQITRTQIEQQTLKSAGNMKRLKPAGYGGDDETDRRDGIDVSGRSAGNFGIGVTDRPDRRDGIDVSGRNAGSERRDGREGNGGRDGIEGGYRSAGNFGIGERDGRDGIGGRDGNGGRDGHDGHDGHDWRDGHEGIDGRDGRDGIGGLDGNARLGYGGDMDALEGMPTEGRKAGGHIVSESRRVTWKEKFAPAGQTTQMIIGASPESDRQIIKMSEALYRRFTMKRVYFSAYIPVADAPELPSLLTPPPLKREHRLYQADWLLRFYGFSADEILTEEAPNLDYDLDPKVVWALRHIEVFPIEINTASEAELLRIPGIGNVSVRRIMRQRRIQKVRYDDLKKMGVVLKRARFFLTCDGRYYGGKEQAPEKLRTLFALEDEISGVGGTKGALKPAGLDALGIRRALGGGESPQLSLFGAQVL